MILDFRYHIFTIAAIFAALGLGILIGSSLIGNETLVNEQKKLITNINEEMKKLREENDLLKAEVNDYEDEITFRREIEKKLLTLGFKDSLEGNNYILLNNGWCDTEGRVARDIFKITGAGLKIKSQLQPGDIKQQNKILVNAKIDPKDVLDQTYLENSQKTPEEKFVKFKSEDITEILLSLIERARDEKKSGISNNTGL